MTAVAIKLIHEWAEAYYEQRNSFATNPKGVKAVQRYHLVIENMLHYARGLGVTDPKEKTE